MYRSNKKYSIVFHSEENYFIVTYSGNVMLDDMKKVFYDYINHPDFKRSMNMIVDCSGAQIIVTPADIISFQSFQDDRHSQRGENYKVAVVCNNESSVKRVESMVEYFRSMPYEMRVFDSIEDSLLWFSESDTTDGDI